MTHDCYSTKRTTVWDQERDGKPGKAVKYADGYISWCPNEAYERDYRPVTGGHMTFGQAIEALKTGKRVRRAHWSDKHALIAVKTVVDLEKYPQYMPYFMLEIEGDSIHVYPTRIPDTLAEDWEELPA